MFVCRACGARSPRWQGQCPQCGEWNALEAAVSTPAEERKGAVPAARSLALGGVASPDAAGAPPGSATAGRAARRSCGSRELDRVLGGGIVAGTYLHGVFENGPWRRRWLNLLRQRRGLAPLSPHAPHHRHQRDSLLERLSAEFTKEINLEPLLRQDL